MRYENLSHHTFVTDVWKEAIPLQKQADENFAQKGDLDLDEYQYYVMKVGYSLAHFMSWLEQLEHAMLYLSDFSYSKKTKEAGINRAKHLLYNVENYLIRLHSAYDRALQVTNDVFHLGVCDSNVGHEIIVSNVKVERTNIKSLLKAVKKAAEVKGNERHKIIHRESYRDEETRRLELYYLFDKDTWENSRSTQRSFESLAHVRSQYLKDALTKKKTEYTQINANLFEKIDALLTGLHKQYSKEQQRLKIYVYARA